MWTASRAASWRRARRARAFCRATRARRDGLMRWRALGKFRASFDRLMQREGLDFHRVMQLHGLGFDRLAQLQVAARPRVDQLVVSDAPSSTTDESMPSLARSDDEW